MGGWGTGAQSSHNKAVTHFQASGFEVVQLKCLDSFPHTHLDASARAEPATFLIPLSCPPRGLQSTLPFMASHVYNQGPRTERTPGQGLPLFLVLLEGMAGLSCDVTLFVQLHLSPRAVRSVCWMDQLSVGTSVLSLSR